MSYQSEEEQVERIRELWNRHGIPLLTGVVIALAGVFGWQSWTKYQENQSANASALYQNMLETIMTGEGEQARTRAAELAQQIRSDYAGTRYAQFAGLMQGRLAVESGDMETAESVLRDVAQQSGDETLQEVARQRLARVLADQERAEEGLELFSGNVEGALLAGREEVRGDLLLGLGRIDEARDAYTAAMQAVDDPRDRPQLQLKLDDLAEEA